MNYEKIYLEWLLDFLKGIKVEIERDGLIATVDEVIIRVSECLNSTTCLSGKEDFLQEKELNK